MDKKRLTGLILAILENNDTQRINFTLVGKSGRAIPVSGARFRRVARAIRSGTINIDYPAPTGSPFKAFYNVKTNTLSVTRDVPFSSRMFDALIVHEALHAAFDLNKSVMTVFESEAAAYIAQGAYLKNSGYGSKIDGATSEDGPVYIGYRLAQSATVDFDDAWMKELETDLSQRRGYAGKLDKEATFDH